MPFMLHVICITENMSAYSYTNVSGDCIHSSHFCAQVCLKQKQQQH